MPFRNVAGRVTLVTGAARGIGRAIAETFLAQGAPVALTDVDDTTLAATVAALSGPGRRIASYRLDVTDAAAFEAVVARTEHDLGPIDVLVNNAGIMPTGPFLDLAPQTDRKQIEINLFGVLNGMRAVLPRMLPRRRGHVVNISSGMGKVAFPGVAVYCATKHAVVGLTEGVRAEHVDSGIGFTYVMPGIVETELTSGTGRLRWPPAVSPQQVADATIAAVRSGQVDVYVPKGVKLAAVLPVLFPRALVESVARMLKADSVFVDLDDRARAAYKARSYAN